MTKLVEKLIVLFAGMTAALLNFNIAAADAGNFNPIMSTPVRDSANGLQSVNTPSTVDNYVDIFANNVYHISQQEGSILMPFVLVEGLVRNAKQIDRIDAMGDPALYTSRGSTVVATNPPQDNRWITAQRYWLATFVDNYDQIRTLFDIRNAYAQAMGMSFGRLSDRVIIAAALGRVWTGPNRQRAVDLPQSQRIAATDGTAHTGLNLNTLRLVRKKMKKSFAAKKGSRIVMAITAEESDSLLQAEQTTSRDFSSILALMHGEISYFYGFIFVETQLIPYNTTAFTFNATTGELSGSGVSVAGTAKTLRCFAFMSGDSLCFGVNQNTMARYTERSDKHYNHQLYYSAEMGAMRKEEVKVVEILTKEMV